MVLRANPLGDIRAEADGTMLESAFLETPDYRNIISAGDRCLVVGRRGTGKSALAFGLARHWRTVPRTHVLLLAPEEDQMIGLRPLIALFGSEFSHLRAGARIAWRYALMMELAQSASAHY